ncbi:MAG: hypothetical protein Q7S98_00760 [Deltaproteobacteria bacterium]|nr:hypothetical protein [Deltaproteobacteria bacterium]
MANTGQITTREQASLLTAASQYLVRVRDERSRSPLREPGQGDFTRETLHRANQALSLLARGQGSQMSEAQRAALQRTFLHLNDSPEVRHDTNAAAALQSAQRALRGLTDPSIVPPVVARSSSPAFLHTAEWPGLEASPPAIYTWLLRTSWRRTLRDIIDPATSGAAQFAFKVTGTEQNHTLSWLLFNDGETRVVVEATYKDGRFQEGWLNLIGTRGEINDGAELPPLSADAETVYRDLEEGLVGFFLGRYLQAHPLPTAPIPPTLRQVVEEGFTSVFGLRGETAGQRFRREMAAYERALEKARANASRGATVSLSLYRPAPTGRAPGGSDTGSTPTTSSGEFPPVSTGGGQQTSAIQYRGSPTAPRQVVTGDDVLLADPAQGGALLFEVRTLQDGAVDVVPAKSLPRAASRPLLP